MLDEKLQEHLIREIKNELQPAFIILFGSYAIDSNHENSDIDLAYFSDQTLTDYERFVFSNKLARIAACEVDLIDLKKSDTVFTFQIFSKGIPIDIEDKNTFIAQRMRAYSMYATLNEQRKPVIDAIKESGRVFDYE